ncbi:MAG: cytochrome c [Planctomycetota bacterium]
MSGDKIPGWITRTLITIACLLLIPPALIARGWVAKAREPRLHPISDMDSQASYKPQQPNRAFADGRASRQPVAGTVARGKLMTDRHFYEGKSGGEWATTFPEMNRTTNQPFVVDEALLARGQERYGIFCAPCHGYDGYGGGMVHVRAQGLSEGGLAPGWVQPTSLHTEGDEGTRGRSVGHLYNSIANGIRNMPPYGSQIRVADRWAIVAYVRALQRSQNAP